MKKLNKSEILLRIASIILGIFLWYIVLNSSNPIQTKTVNIPLEIYNETQPALQSLGIINESQISNSVSITLKGRKDDLENLNLLDINANVDYIKLLREGSIKLDINIDNRNEKLSIVSYEPKQLDIELEEIVEKSFSIEVVPVGDPAEGYKLISVYASPEQISVKGFKSEIDSIKSAVVYFDITNSDKNRSFTKYIEFYNDKDEVIQALSKEFTTELTASIGKKVDLNILFEGDVENGYYLKDYISYADAVYITGPYDVISKLSEIKIKPIDLTNMKENVTLDIEPILAGNIQIISVDGELRIDLTVSKYKNRTILLKKNDILTPGADHLTNIYEVITDSFEIIVKAKDEVLDALLKTDINALIDVEGLTPGLYNLPIAFEFSKEIEILGQYTATINITPRTIETTVPQ